METHRSLVSTFVYPISGAPLLVEITAEHVEMSETGSPSIRREVAVVYRDFGGKVRNEVERPDAELNQNVGMVQIIDTTEGFMAILVPIANRAFRRKFPAYSPGTSSSGVSLFGGPSVALSGELGQRTVVTEALGKRLIEGVEFEGELTTVTVKGERILEATQENWYSKDLGLFGLKITKDPDGKTTSRITKLVRKEPDPSLFIIPSDYVIEEKVSLLLLQLKFNLSPARCRDILDGDRSRFVN